MRNDGGPAFPYQHDMVLYQNDKREKPAQTIRGVWEGGMSLRDYFAAQAIAALADEGRSLDEYQFVAARAYRIADAMLKARERPD